MHGPIGYTVVLDASVLVPSFLSNLLLWLSEMDLFQAKWSPDIHADIKCGANAIVTTNIKHFKPEYIAQYNIVAVHQDDFILDQLTVNDILLATFQLLLCGIKKA